MIPFSTNEAAHVQPRPIDNKLVGLTLRCRREEQSVMSSLLPPRGNVVTSACSGLGARKIQ